MLTNWVPVLVQTESDLEFVVRKDLMVRFKYFVVLPDNRVQKPIAFTKI